MPRTKKLQIEAVIQDEENTALEVAKSDVEVSDFELVADIVVGKLTSNAKEFSAALENELKKYTVERYLDDPDAAKTDKAYLNKLKEQVADKRKKATEIWNKPLDEFISIIKDLEKKIDCASNDLKTIVDQAAQKEKDEKYGKIEEFWNTLNFTIVPLDRVFNPKWLNKTEKMQNIMDECRAIVDKINTEMATLKSMQDEDSETLLSFYLDTLDLNATLQKGNQLKENRAKITAEEERKAAADKLPFGKPVIPSAEQKKEYNEQEIEEISKRNLTIEPTATFRLEVTAPASKLKALRQYIDSNGITYRKL